MSGSRAHGIEVIVNASTPLPEVDVITAVGRKETYLAKAAQSVAEFARAAGVVTHHWLVSDGPRPDWIEQQTPRADALYRPRILDPKGERQGPARTRNRGLAAGESTIIMTLDSDDMYQPAEMAGLLSALLVNDAPWAAGRTVDIDSEGAHRWSGPYIEMPDGWTEVDAFRASGRRRGYLPFHCCATIARRSLVEEVGGWDESPTYLRGQDVAMWARMTRNTIGWFSHRPVLLWRKHGISYTALPDPRFDGGLQLIDDDVLDNPAPSSGSFATDLRHDEAHLAISSWPLV